MIRLALWVSGIGNLLFLGALGYVVGWVIGLTWDALMLLLAGVTLLLFAAKGITLMQALRYRRGRGLHRAAKASALVSLIGSALLFGMLLHSLLGDRHPERTPFYVAALLIHLTDAALAMWVLYRKPRHRQS